MARAKQGRSARGMLKPLPPMLAPVAPLLRDPGKVADRFYLSPEWRALVRSIKALRGAWCERCGARGRIIGDHKVEIKDGGAMLDPANVELLCMACHNRKTAQAKARRAGM